MIDYSKGGRKKGEEKRSEKHVLHIQGPARMVVSVAIGQQAQVSMLEK